MGKQKKKATHRPEKNPPRPGRRASSRGPSRKKQPASARLDRRRLLADRESVFEALINAYPDFAMILDRDGRLLACNRAVQQRLSQKGGGRRRTIFDAFPHVDRPSWRKALEGCRDEPLDSARDWRKALRFEREVDGLYYSHNICPVAGGGEIVVVFVQDVTEYRRAENALQESERKYRELVENISDAIYALNEEGDVIYVNPAVETFLGFSQEEARGRPLLDFLHPAEAAFVADNREGFLAGSAPQREYRFRHKDGSVRWGRVSSRPVVFKDEVIGYQGVISDITQVKTFNVSLLRVVQENILSSLAAAFTAEIGVPLKRARERLLSHSAPAGVDAEINASLRALMHDLEGISLYLKHFTAFTGREGEAARPLDVNTLIESALALLARELERAGIETQCRLARDLEPVSADSFSLVQSFMNVFNCSLRACGTESDAGSPKKLTVTTAMDQDKVIVDVRDSSEGISDELIAHLADPFYAHRLRKDAGIGLAIARQLVESQGGFFQIISGEEPAGMHLRISFPSIIQAI